jgi:hypothetical protein
MVRARLGSLLGVLCSTLFALSLLLVVDTHAPHWVGFLWLLCGALLISSVGLWFRKRWARLAFLLVASWLLLLYIAEIGLAPGGCAGTMSGCYNYYIQHDPLLAVAHYFAYLTCSHDLDLCCSEQLVRCIKRSMYVQPALTLFAMVVLLKPLASNNRSSGP